MKAFTHKLSDRRPIKKLDQHLYEEQQTRRDQWDAEQEAQEHENDLRWESLMADESEYGPPCNEPGFPWK